MSDELRIAREGVDKLIHDVTKPDWLATGYDRRVLQVLLVLSELCNAVETLERRADNPPVPFSERRM